MIRTRPKSGLVTPAVTRRGSLSVLLAGSVLALLGCGMDAEDPQSRDSYAAVAPAEEPSAGQEENTASGEGADPMKQGATADQELLSEQEIAELLVSEDELPFAPDSHSTLTGLAFFQDHLNTGDQIYAESFGAGECTSAMDEINADLVGENPQGGVVQEYQHELSDRTETLYVWMLGLEAPQDSAQVWDTVIEACTEEPLEGETDSVAFEPFEDHGFRGIQLDMDVLHGDSTVEVQGFSASRDYGRHLLMISAANMEAETFQEVVAVQAEKLASHDYERLGPAES